MIAHRGSIRYILQSVGNLRLPSGFHPHNSRWKFRRKQHEVALRSYSRRLRNTADEIDAWLQKEEGREK